MCTEDQQTNRMDTLDSERVIMNAHTDYQVIYNRGEILENFKLFLRNCTYTVNLNSFVKKKLMFCSKISHSFFTWLESYKLTHPRIWKIIWKTMKLKSYHYLILICFLEKGHVYWGEYPLSFAACLGQEECYRWTLCCF